MFVLLDLIGHKGIQLNNYFDRTTGKYFNRLRDIGSFTFFLLCLSEIFFSESGLLRSYTAANDPNAYKRVTFSSQLPYGSIEDDHIPFLNLGKILKISF